MSLLISITSINIALSSKADTVDARCDVFPKGEDKAISSGICTFSQRQGIVGIQLENGKLYNLIPGGDNPGEYQVEENGKKAYGEDSLEGRGVVYRLEDKSIYGDTEPYQK